MFCTLTPVCSIDIPAERKIALRKEQVSVRCRRRPIGQLKVWFRLGLLVRTDLDKAFSAGSIAACSALLAPGNVETVILRQSKNGD